jgi:hypothetical protein
MSLLYFHLIPFSINSHHYPILHYFSLLKNIPNLNQDKLAPSQKSFSIIAVIINSNFKSRKYFSYLNSKTFLIIFKSTF